MTLAKKMSLEVVAENSDMTHAVVRKVEVEKPF